MIADRRWPRGLVIAGLVAMVLGAVDPMEGSIVILAGSALAALGSSLTHSRHAPMLLWSFALVLFGVGSMWVFSFFGGFGGTTGTSKWWMVTIVPYPIGWLLGLLGCWRRLHEAPNVSTAT
ncbi:MAG: hypothetical protein IPP90_13795 [Gemmatimonadaceae bacterium]|nr:hypothetical protein [Gemmatimonadaceae bacterium]